MFLKATTRFASDIEAKEGISERYERLLDELLVPKAPKAEPPAVDCRAFHTMVG